MEEQVGIAVVGCGRISASHLDGIQKCSDKAFIAAVVDIDESRAKKTAQVFDTKYYTSVESALRDPKVRAMVVCLSHDQHYLASMQAMRAGRHVLVEKPIATSYTQAAEMVELSRKKGVVLMVGVCRRHMIALQELKKRMELEIGNPFNFLYVMAEFFDEGKAPPWWRNESKTGGLTVSMLGSHSIDQTLWFFEGKKPVRVYAEGKVVNSIFEGYGEVTIVMKFDDGAMATNHLSIHTQPPVTGGMIVGPKGSAHFIHGEPYCNLVGVRPTELYMNGHQVMSGKQDPHNFAVQMNEFVSAIIQGREPWVNSDQILTGMKIMEAARKSIETAQPVTL